MEFALIRPGGGLQQCIMRLHETHPHFTKPTIAQVSDSTQPPEQVNRY